MMKTWGLLIVAASLALAVAGCSSGGSSSSGTAPAKAVTVTAKDMKYDSKELTLTKGEAVKLSFTNNDSQLHDFSISKISVKMNAKHEDSHQTHGKAPDLHVSADAGKTGTLEFTPQAAGTYSFYCTVAGHKEAGMLGTLIVK